MRGLSQTPPRPPNRIWGRVASFSPQQPSQPRSPGKAIPDVHRGVLPSSSSSSAPPARWGRQAPPTAARGGGQPPALGRAHRRGEARRRRVIAAARPERRTGIRGAPLARRGRAIPSAPSRPLRPCLGRARAPTHLLAPWPACAPTRARSRSPSGRGLGVPRAAGGGLGMRGRGPSRAWLLRHLAGRAGLWRGLRPGRTPQSQTGPASPSAARPPHLESICGRPAALGRKTGRLLARGAGEKGPRASPPTGRAEKASVPA